MARNVHLSEVMAQPIRRRIVEILASGEHFAGNIDAIIINEFGVRRSAVQRNSQCFATTDLSTSTRTTGCATDTASNNFIGLLERYSGLLKKKRKRRIG